MNQEPKSIRRRLLDGQTCIGHMVMEFVSPGLTTILARAGCDFVLLDTEHTRFSVETIGTQLRLARGAGLPAFVRVPRGQFTQMSRLLDLGAEGIMAPNVESGEEAGRIVQFTRYAPWGRRGSGLGIAHDDYQPGDAVGKFERSNQRTLAIAQIESGEGVAHVDEIVGTEGIDVAWIGHNDLTLDLGIPGQFDHPTYTEAVTTVLAACARHGKAAGFAGGTPERVVELARQGFRCLAYSNDIRLYADALTDGLQSIRKTLGTER